MYWETACKRCNVKLKRQISESLSLTLSVGRTEYLFLSLPLSIYLSPFLSLSFISSISYPIGFFSFPAPLTLLRAGEKERERYIERGRESSCLKNVFFSIGSKLIFSARFSHFLFLLSFSFSISFSPRPLPPVLHPFYKFVSTSYMYVCIFVR